MRTFTDFIVCLDIETTGLDKKTDRILQLSLGKFERITGKIVDTRNWFIKPSGDYVINPDAAAVHGITDEILNEKGVSLRDIFTDLSNFINGCDILTYNGMVFDLPMLIADLEREGLALDFSNTQFVDGLDIEKKLTSHKLVDTYRRYYGEVYEDAHDSMQDVYATIKVYLKQRLQDKDIIINSIENVNRSFQMNLSYVYYDPTTGDLTFKSGKYRDKSTDLIYETDLQYINWMTSVGKLSEGDRKAIEEHYFKNGQFAEKAI